MLLRLPGHPADPVRALSLPRDLLVDLDGFGPQKLAAALGLGGSRLLVRAVRQATGVPVHHYVEVDFAGFASAVDRLGGVTVDLDAPARDPYSGFEAGSGRQRLDGEAALAYVRSRNYEELRQGEWVAAGGGDLARIERQHRLLQAAVAEAASASPVEAVRWLGDVGPHLTVDARLGSGGLHRLARRLAGADALDLTTLPVRLLHEETTAASPFAPAHPGTIRYLVAAEPEAGLLLGSWRAGGTAPLTEPTVTAAPPAPEAYDLFISFADDDREWVEGYLLDALDQAGVRYLHAEAFRLGVPDVIEFQRAVKSSARTLLVLSPAYFASSMAEFVDVLAQSYGQETGTWPIIPLLLEEVEIPPRLRQLRGLDASGGHETWTGVVARLCAELNRPPPGATPAPACPFPGMVPFSEAEAGLFFGREEEVGELVQKLRTHPFLAVIGPSGSGKSSLVAAGLVPALRRSRQFGEGGWAVRWLRPGDDPAGALAAALDAPDPTDPGSAAAGLLAAAGPDTTRLLVVADQLEELFTLGTGGAEAFEGGLRALTGRPDVWLVLTCRADFYPQLMTSSLWELVDAHRVEVLPLGGDGLRKAIERPAEAVGVHVESALVERLVADASGEPGMLPLVQETMVCLWERLERRLLPLSAYEALVLPRRAYGDREQTGLQVAMARRADAAMAALPPADQAVARRIFVRLVQFGEGRDDIRRRQPAAALRSAADDGGTVDRVLEHLAARRLLTLSGGRSPGGQPAAGADGGAGGQTAGEQTAGEQTAGGQTAGEQTAGERTAGEQTAGEQTVGERTAGERTADERMVDLSHEALIGGWPTLQGWLGARREGELTRRRLVDKAHEWARLGRAEGGLLDAVELLEAERWLAGPDAPELGVDRDLDTLVTTSAAALTRRREEAEADRQRELAQANALAAEQQERARVERERADDQVLTSSRLRRRSRAIAAVLVLTLVAAVFAGSQWRRAEQEARVNTSRELAAEARPLAEEHLDLALLLSQEAYRRSPTVEARGALLSAIETDPRLTTYLHDHTDRAGPAVFSPDGRLVASGGDDKRIILWDVATRVPFELRYDARDEIRTVAFTPDGSLLATGGHHLDRSITVWDLATRTRHHSLTGHTEDVRSLAFSPDGATLASVGVEGKVFLWDVASGRERGRLDHGGSASSLDFTPDGALLATGGDDGRVVLWDTARGEQAAVLTGPTGHTGYVRTLAFSHDGLTLATAGDFGGVESGLLLWDVARREQIQSLVGHRARVFSLAFSSDNRTLASAGRDSTVLLWDYRAGVLSEPPLTGHFNSVRSVAFAPDGDTMVTAGDDSIVALWRRNAGPHLARILSEGSDPVSEVVSNGRGLVAVGRSGGFVTLWDAAIGKARGEPLEHPESVTSVALSADGPAVAAGGLDGTVLVWDTGSGAVLGRVAWPVPGQAVLAVALSPDGRTVAAGGTDGTLRRWDVGSGRELESLPTTSDHLVSLAWSPDGRRLAAGARDGRLWAWDLDRAVPRRRLLNCPRSEEVLVCARTMRSIAFNPRGDRLAAGSADNSVTIWDPGREQAAKPTMRLSGHSLPVNAVAFSPDGRVLASGGEDERLVLWDARTGLRIGDPLTAHDGPVVGVAVAARGDTVLTGGDDGRLVTWDLRVSTARTVACAVANRNLTPEEGRQYLGTSTPRLTCRPSG